MFKQAAIAMLVMVPGAALADPGAMIDNYYVEAYGGVRLANTLDYNGGAYDLNAGGSFGATFGVTTSVPGLSFDIDAMHVSADYTCCAPDPLASTSLMVDVNYEAMLNDTFGAFAGVGAGVIYLDYNNATDTGYGAGFQAKAGLTAKVSDQVSLFGEVKYQGAVGGSISVSGSHPPYLIEYNTTSILGGIRFAMK